MDNKNGYKKSPVGWIPVEWEVKPVKSFGKVQTGSTPPTDELENYGAEFRFVSPADLGNGKYILETSKGLSRKGFTRSRNFPKGSILVTCIGSTIGKMGIAGLDLTSNQQINAITVNGENDNEYLYYELNRHSEKIRNLAGEQAVPIVNKSTFESFLVAAPPLPEQRAIAAVLRACDEAIEKTQALLTALRRRHAGLMQALLSGKKRVKGLARRWKKGTFADLVEVEMGQSPEGTTYNFDGLGVPLINGPTEFTDTFPIKIQWTTKPTKVCKKGDILLCVRGSSTGRMNIANDEYCIGRGIAALRGKGGVDTEFIKFHVRLAVNKILSLSAGSTFPNIDKKSISTIPIPTPSLPEQRAITAILQASEAEIRGYERQAALLQRQKKGLMQVLLTGRVRVKNAGQ